MDNPIGPCGSEGCKILSNLPNRMLSFTFNVPMQFQKAREFQNQNWLVIEFDYNEFDKTKIS
jgi:hypothetical protein